MAKPDVSKINEGFRGLQWVQALLLSLALTGCHPPSQQLEEPQNKSAENCPNKEALFAFPNLKEPERGWKSLPALEMFDEMVSQKLQLLREAGFTHAEVLDFYEMKRWEIRTSGGDEKIKDMQGLNHELDRCVFKHNHDLLAKAGFFEKIGGWDGLRPEDQIKWLNDAIKQADLGGKCSSAEVLGLLEQMIIVGEMSERARTMLGNEGLTWGVTKL